MDDRQSYAPVFERTNGQAEVQLGSNHPGASDPAYRARRNAIATLALRWQPGTPVPDAPYDEAEHAVWRNVARELEPLHRRHGCQEFLTGKERLGLPAGHVPQLTEVTALLQPLTGFRYIPAAGLVPLREFYESLAAGRFHSTQYVRHHSVPLYTPEPDVIHEVVGHANCLASERYAALYRVAGEAARRVRTAEALEFVSRVFWFSLEFGVLHEDGALKVYGAGILSSYGELGDYLASYRAAQVRPLDIAAMGRAEYDITTYQPLLYAARSFEHVEDTIGDFFTHCDDESIRELSERRVPA
jgi:phenylalanine-4-hydroxylase